MRFRALRGHALEGLVCRMPGTREGAGAVSVSGGGGCMFGFGSVSVSSVSSVVTYRHV